MPVSHITLHAYATWMPDRVQGSVHWQRGYQSKDNRLADVYRMNQREPAASFDEGVQRTFIDAALETATHRSLRIHAIATEPAHVHIICSWTDARAPEFVRDRLKRAMSRRLNAEHGPRTWFTRKGDCTPVRNREHFGYLRDVYLPSHPGMR